MAEYAFLKGVALRNTPIFRGMLYVFLRCKVTPDISLSVIKLANVSDVRESAHMYIPTI